jgi:hypothetical protein
LYSLATLSRRMGAGDVAHMREIRTYYILVMKLQGERTHCRHLCISEGMMIMSMG